MVHELFRVFRSAEVQSRAPRILPLIPCWNLTSPDSSRAPPLQRRPLALLPPLLQLNPLLAHLVHVEETQTAQIREILLHLFQMTWQKVTIVPQTQQWMEEKRELLHYRLILATCCYCSSPEMKKWLNH